MLTQERVRELFDYDPETGVLFWKEYGYRAGSVWSSGYRIVEVGGKALREHRLIWLWMSGHCPKYVDHINGDKTDNRWCNLRAASKRENAQNMRPRKNNLKGTHYCSARKKYVAQIMADGKHRNLGRFDTEQEAHEAYWAAAQKYFGEFARKE